MILQELLALIEANTSSRKATFKKYTDFKSWNDDNGADYSETEIEGKRVGVLHDGQNVIGLWYNKAGVGSISTDFAKVFPKLAEDEVAFCEKDPYWPYN